MKCSIRQDSVFWRHENECITVLVSDVDQAVFSRDQNSVVVLSDECCCSKKITVYAPDGLFRCEISQPKEHFFNCLGENRGNDVAVLSTVYDIGWRDWWFAINIKEKTLESLGEGR